MVATIPDTTAQAISPVDAIWSIIQSQSSDVKRAIFLRIEAEQRKSAAVNDGVLRQLSELESGSAGFLKLDSILPPSKLTAEELREDAYKEKYGI